MTVSGRRMPREPKPQVLPPADDPVFVDPIEPGLDDPKSVEPIAPGLDIIYAILPHLNKPGLDDPKPAEPIAPGLDDIIYANKPYPADDYPYHIVGYPSWFRPLQVPEPVGPIDLIDPIAPIEAIGPIDPVEPVPIYGAITV